MSAAIVAFVTALWFLRGARSPIVDGNDSITCLGQRRHDIAPRIPGLRPIVEEQDQRAVVGATNYIVETDTVYVCNELARET
jgi:hypothetical protein